MFDNETTEALRDASAALALAEEGHPDVEELKRAERSIAGARIGVMSAALGARSARRAILKAESERLAGLAKRVKSARINAEFDAR